MAALIGIENLVKRYGRYQAFEPVSLDIDRGDLVVVTGGNGAGKTSLIRCICGLDSFDGQINFGHGRPQTSAVFDDPVMPREIRTKWLLRMYRLSHLDLAKFGLDDSVMAKRISDLSFGQRRRLAIAICFGRSPSLAVLDEPLVGLDGSGQELVIELIGSELKSGTTVMVTTHAPERLSHFPHKSIHLERAGAKAVGVDD